MMRRGCNSFPGRSAGRILVAALLVVFSIRATVLSAKATPKAIETAISKAKGFLLKSGLSGKLPQAALAVAALIKSGVDPDHPEIKKVLDRISAQCRPGGQYTPADGGGTSYAATVFLMALANSAPETYQSEIRFLAGWLVQKQTSSGSWDYPSRQDGDTSQTQYALLGLWEASRAGVDIPLVVFVKAAIWHLTHQSANKGFDYHPLIQIGPGRPRNNRSTHSMTAAGIGSLQICRLFLFPNATLVPSGSVAPGKEEKEEEEKKKKKRYSILKDPSKAKTKAGIASARRQHSGVTAVQLAMIDAAIAKALEWMTEQYTISQPTGWPLYYLYSLERMSALSHVDVIGNHDWYSEGASHLIATQSKDGHWAGRTAMGVTTSFGLMFMVRATGKMLGRRHGYHLKGGLLAGGRGLPENLAQINVVGGKVKKHKYTGPVDELLAVLENPRSKRFFDAQEALVETVIVKDPKALVGKTDQLLKLSKVPNDEVRRTAMWALGRSQDIAVVPTLITALDDANLDVVLEARNALRFISKNIEGLGLPDQPTLPERKKAIARWREWYFTVRPYDERDDIPP